MQAEIKEPDIYDHERRIINLEDSNEEAKKNYERMSLTLNELSKNAAINDALAKERNINLMKQIDSIATDSKSTNKTLDKVFDNVIMSRENDAVRKNELKKISKKNVNQILVSILGSGGLVYILIEFAKYIIVK